ncbi:recombinase family protein [Tellurirhabdus bombi]|uniref:recombinase family protein n=1 Tax=Tellurirhabdus bombi TaxID=2907205 RepID=UPI001F1873A3|nr:recombinase family protein [Tellurirhabdus bombi]
MLIGYARVSTTDQNPELQLDALKAAGCERIFIDKSSGTKAERPELSKLKEQLRRGDVMVVWRLDRLGRSLQHLISWIDFLQIEGVEFRSLTEMLDTSTPTGKLVFHVTGAFAEFERNIIVERTNAGLKAARARGRKGGRRYKVDEKKRAMAVQLYHEGKSVKEICDLLGILKQTLYTYVNKAKAEKSNNPLRASEN